MQRTKTPFARRETNPARSSASRIARQTALSSPASRAGRPRSIPVPGISRNIPLTRAKASVGERRAWRLNGICRFTVATLVFSVELLRLVEVGYWPGGPLGTRAATRSDYRTIAPLRIERGAGAAINPVALF